MPRYYYPLIRRVRAVVEVLVPGDAVANVLTRLRAGTSVTTTLDTRAPASTGSSIVLAPADLRVVQAAGTVVRETVDGETTVRTAAGSGQRITADLQRAPAGTGGQVLRIRDTLIRDAPAAFGLSATLDGRSDWVNPNNAAGKPDGSYATCSGSAAGARSGLLLAAHDDSRGKSDFIIASVQVRYHLRVAGTLLANADVQLQYRIGAGAYITLQTLTSDVNALVAGITIAVPVTTWADVDALQPFVAFRSAVGETFTCEVDAVRIIVTASLDL